MTHKERAAKLLEQINAQRNRIAGGYEIPREEPGPVAMIAAALEQAAQEALTELGDLKLRLNCPMVAPSCLVCGQQKEFVMRHLEASAIGVCGDCRNAAQAAQPVWSKERPTGVGLWLYRYSRAHEIELVTVKCGEKSGGLGYLHVDGRRYIHGDLYDIHHGEWAGPLSPPREAAEWADEQAELNCGAATAVCMNVADNVEAQATARETLYKETKP